MWWDFINFLSTILPNFLYPIAFYIYRCQSWIACSESHLKCHGFMVNKSRVHLGRLIHLPNIWNDQMNYIQMTRRFRKWNIGGNFYSMTVGVNCFDIVNSRSLKLTNLLSYFDYASIPACLITSTSADQHNSHLYVKINWFIWTTQRPMLTGPFFSVSCVHCLFFCLHFKYLPVRPALPGSASEQVTKILDFNPSLRYPVGLATVRFVIHLTPKAFASQFQFPDLIRLYRWVVNHARPKRSWCLGASSQPHPIWDIQDAYLHHCRAFCSVIRASSYSSGISFKGTVSLDLHGTGWNEAKWYQVRMFDRQSFSS